MLAPTRILVPTDFSPYSDRALVQALDIAKQYRAKVFLLHVLHEDVHRGNLEFTFPEGKDIEKRATYYYTLSGDIPYGTGCEECRFYKEELYCEKKEKYLARKLKTCKFFSQKESEN